MVINAGTPGTCTHCTTCYPAHALTVRHVAPHFFPGEHQFVFDGKNMTINRQLAIFITMNPMYEHRSVLPSNLKALFRPLAMMVPDNTMIAEVSLYAAGFRTASTVAVKLVTCLKVGGVGGGRGAGERGGGGGVWRGRACVTLQHR